MFPVSPAVCVAALRRYKAIDSHLRVLPRGSVIAARQAQRDRRERAPDPTTVTALDRVRNQNGKGQTDSEQSCKRTREHTRRNGSSKLATHQTKLVIESSVKLEVLLVD